jgi:hypothetical protein
MGRTRSTLREKNNTCRILVGKPEGKRPLGRPRRSWLDNIKMGIEDGGVDWIDPAQDRDKQRDLINTVINVRVP